MALFSADTTLREPFSLLVGKLLSEEGIKAEDVFFHALESEADAQMNYWVVRLLIERKAVDPLLAISQDAVGAAVKPLHAACLLHNIGALAALLDIKAYEASPLGKDYLAALRICQKQGFDQGAGLMMAHAKKLDFLDALLMTLQGLKPH
ncbi:hypothetical protein THIAE_00445 [Thiomicrospira aerophila AL3]|uniref:Ankyrin n=1 Tax=Thiomicrospira aerophila AL3 TaxID=717772 RepID=W0DU62_9GAMM|nr:hypothetical protein [Thiomicrospira aerophila]AHF00416.1 hypothetical protein THIAE_00445 [Thiomicrospira aerophila AL3]